MRHGQGEFNRHLNSFLPKGIASPSQGLYMNFRALRDSFDFFHNSRRNLLALAVVALVAYECAEIIIEDNFLDLYYFGLVILGIVGFLAIFKNWRLGLYGFVR